MGEQVKLLSSANIFGKIDVWYTFYEYRMKMTPYSYAEKLTSVDFTPKDPNFNLHEPVIRQQNRS